MKSNVRTTRLLAIAIHRPPNQTHTLAPLRFPSPTTNTHTDTPTITITTPPSDTTTTQSAHIKLGLVLALNAGFVNGCCLSGLACAQAASVAAVTASWTNAALALASGNMSQFQWFAQLIVSFLVGSAISGYILSDPDQLPTAPLGIGALLLFAAALRQSAPLGLSLCCMANGLQNSVTSSLTHNLCRTSHFSGVTSDIGTYVGQMLRGNRQNARKCRIFVGLTTCFATGGGLAYWVARRWGSVSLVLSAALYAGIVALNQRGVIPS